MYRLKSDENRISITSRATQVQKKLAYVLVSMVLVFITVQFIILAVVGAKGDLLSKIKNSQDEQRIQNEILRADVMEAQVASKIKSDVEQNLGMKEVKLQVLESKSDITAQN
jgi:hypothetical protein